MKYDYKKKYKIGDIIYPYYNDTAIWYKTSIWSVVEKIHKDGHWRLLRHFRSDETAFLYSEIIKRDKKKNKKK